MAWTKTERREAIKHLRASVKPGDTLYTDLQHVSRSGMLRVIQVIQIEDNEPQYIGWRVAAALDMPYDDRRRGVRIGGCGMDMGFAIINHLGYALFPDGFGCIGDGCPSNDHSNGDRDYRPHCDGNHTELCVGCGSGHTHWHTSGAYALRHRWL